MWADDYYFSSEDSLLVVFRRYKMSGNNSDNDNDFYFVFGFVYGCVSLSTDKVLVSVISFIFMSGWKRTLKSVKVELGGRENPFSLTHFSVTQSYFINQETSFI